VVTPARAVPALFAESSALVAWLVWEEGGAGVLAWLRRARACWISALAPAECGRALERALAGRRIDAAYARAARRRLVRFAAGCRVIPVDEEILTRAGHAFPVEPIRTLDAVHLASWERAHGASPRLVMLSLDARVRENARLLGADIAP
jgi:predicted nucleic acid-binding protein